MRAAFRSSDKRTSGRTAAYQSAQVADLRRPKRGRRSRATNRPGISGRLQSAERQRGVRGPRAARQRAAHPASIVLPASHALTTHALTTHALASTEALLSADLQGVGSALLGMPSLVGIPTRLALTPDKCAARLASIAEGCALAGILDDRDLADEGAVLTDSVSRSLSRLIQGQGAADLGWFSLSLSYTDDLTECDEPSFTLSQQDSEAGRTTGGFRLIVKAAPTAVLGRRILALEKVSRGSGYAMLGLLESVLDATVGVAGPAWCLDIIGMMGADDWDEEDVDDGVVTTDRFLQHVPAKACACMWNERAVRDALVPTLLGGPSRPQVRTLEAALSLYEAWQETGALDTSDWGYLNDRHEFECDIVRACVLRWSEKDHVVQIFDDYCEQMQNMGDEYSEASFVAAFRLDPADTLASAESVRNAAVRLSGVLTLLTRAEALIGLLHTEPRKPREKKTPLIKVLVDDYNARHEGEERNTDGERIGDGRLLTAL